MGLQNKISLCLTNWNRNELLLESFAQVLDDDRISEIIISDDHSEEPNYDILQRSVKQWPKVKLFRTENNVGCYVNKARAISHATNDYVIIFDSDNIIDRSYIDALYKVEWNPDVILQPEYAKPAFNFTPWSGMTISKDNVAGLFNTSNAVKSQFDCLLNVMNYCVHKDSYLQVWEDCPEPYAADTILQNYNWFKSGKKMFVVPGMQYYHRLHTGSHFIAHEKKSRELHKQVADKIKMMA